MALAHVGGGNFLDLNEVEDPNRQRRLGGRRAHLIPYVGKKEEVHVNAYVTFVSLFRIYYGLQRTVGGPRTEVIERVNVGTFERDESVAPYWYLSDAMSELERGEDRRSWAFEEVPYVEVDDKEDYDEVLRLMEIASEDGAWEKSGLYDFRDEPPSYSGTVEEYEIDSMKYEAEQTLDYMFQGDEWKEAYETLATEED